MCREKTTKEIFAMKILKKDLIVAKDQITNTMTENRVLRSSKHPFITVSVLCKCFCLIMCVLHIV